MKCAFLDLYCFPVKPRTRDFADAQRSWREAARTLGKLHSVKLSKVGLDAWKRPADFYTRQVKSLGSVSAAQARTRSNSSNGHEVGQFPYFDELVSFFADKGLQPGERKVLVHGDFKLDNLVFHKSRAEVIGILDWEMATEGHPLSDLANLISPFTWSAGQVPVLAELSLTEELKQWQAMSGPDRLGGLPSVAQLQAWYGDAAGWVASQRDLDWAVAFSNFRTAVIMQGIAARLARGQQSGIKARQFAQQALPYSLWCRARVQKLKQAAHSRLGKL